MNITASPAINGGRFSTSVPSGSLAVFRPNRPEIALRLVCSFSLLPVGALVGGILGGMLMSAALCGLVSGCYWLLFRVEVTDSGLRKYAFGYWRLLELQFSEITSCSVEKGPDFRKSAWHRNPLVQQKDLLLQIHLKSARRPVRVYDFQVSKEAWLSFLELMPQPAHCSNPAVQA